MAMGKRDREQQPELWISHEHVPRSQGHPFYEALNRTLNHYSFDDWVEQACQRFYHARLGRPGVAPGVYFRCLLVGYFEARQTR